MGGCKTALDKKRYNWRHDSILAVPLNFTKTTENIKIHCDTEGYMNPSVITGEENCPDMMTQQSLVLELTVGFESNTALNTKQKAES